MNRKLIIANWKMNPQSIEEAERLFDNVIHGLKEANFKNIELVFAPPFPYIHDLRKRLAKDIKLAAQNIGFAERGAYTGEVSALMVKNLRCDYVIIGHSERRWKLNETDEMINLKLKQALAVGLKPVLAIGERTEDDNLSLVLGGQIKKALKDLDESALEKLIIAYEPVWAIGTGKPDTPDGALSAAILIKKIVNNIYGANKSKKLPILYGGSVAPSNIKSFVLQEGIDGALVGGASLKAQDFIKMIKLAMNVE